jgi:hypothetical protein
MAVLDTTNRARVTAQVMRNGIGTFGGMTKADLRAAVDATDQWIEDNGATYNLSLPQPARGALTATQKTLLFCFVAMRRAGLLRAEED